MDEPYDYPPDIDRDFHKPVRPKRGDWSPSGSRQRAAFSLGKLQIAGILLIVVFVWALISAVAIGMFGIHVLALTEFEDDGKADVSGYVTDSEGQALVNVTVVIHGTQHFSRTNFEGFYTIENVKEGNYEIEASKNGYGSVTKRVSLNPNSPTLVNFVLEEGGFDTTVNERYGSNLSDLANLNMATAIIIMIYGTIALIGGILCYLQRLYYLCMFGALCGIVSGVLSIGIFIAPIIAIIALIYILRNQEEFVSSETSFMDRIFGVRPKTRPAGISRGGSYKSKGPSSTKKLKPKKQRPDYLESEYPPPMVQEDDLGEIGPPVPSDMPEPSGPPFKCRACGGTVKSEAQGIFCQCGASYHIFCANSISRCKSCGTQF